MIQSDSFVTSLKYLHASDGTYVTSRLSASVSECCSPSPGVRSVDAFISWTVRNCPKRSPTQHTHRTAGADAAGTPTWHTHRHHHRPSAHSLVWHPRVALAHVLEHDLTSCHTSRALALVHHGCGNGRSPQPSPQALSFLPPVILASS